VLLIEYDFPIGTHIDHSTTAHGMSSILIPKDFVDSSLDVTPHGMLFSKDYTENIDVNFDMGVSG
jgi:hypothetical protein